MRLLEIEGKKAEAFRHY